MESYSKTSMFDYGVECKDCHMPYATKSAKALGPHQGDLQTHIFYIDTDPEANMFTEDGGFVVLDDNGKAKVTMDFACQRCHETASLDELALYAEDFHSENKSLEDIGLDPGLTGTRHLVECFTLRRRHPARSGLHQWFVVHVRILLHLWNRR
jgi:hypothetical protein